VGCAWRAVCEEARSTGSEEVPAAAPTAVACAAGGLDVAMQAALVDLQVQMQCVWDMRTADSLATVGVPETVANLPPIASWQCVSDSLIRLMKMHAVPAVAFLGT
jgi:hypothetical protein